MVTGVCLCVCGWLAGWVCVARTGDLSMDDSFGRRSASRSSSVSSSARRGQSPADAMSPQQREAQRQSMKRCVPSLETPCSSFIKLCSARLGTVDIHQNWMCAMSPCPRPQPANRVSEGVRQTRRIDIHRSVCLMPVFSLCLAAQTRCSASRRRWRRS